MRSHPLTSWLVGLLALSILATAALTLYYVRSVQTLNLLQLQNAVIVRNRNLASALANEALEYSRHNPAMDPILQSVGLKPKPGMPANSAPTTPRP